MRGGNRSEMAIGKGGVAIPGCKKEFRLQAKEKISE